MLSMIFIVTVVCVALILLVRRGWWRRGSAQLLPAAVPLSALALEAFIQGNTDLAGGKFTEATAAFQRTRELDPKHPYVVERLAAVERRQHEMTTAKREADIIESHAAA